MADYVPLLIAGAVAYYVLVVNPSILSSITGALTPAGGAPVSTTPTAACQGKDKTTGAACDCPAPTTAAAMAYAYKGSKKKSSSKSSKSSKSSTSGSSSTTQTKTQTTSSCDCSACTAGATPAPTTPAPSGNSIWCKCVGGKWAQDPTFKGSSVKCALIGQTCTGSATGAVGYSDLNGFAGQAIAREGWGHEALQAYYRRSW